MPMTVTMILDGGLGDSGKGRFAAYLALVQDFGHVVADGTGVGGAHVLKDQYTGEDILCSSVPVGLVNPRSKLYIGPGTLVDEQGLTEEIDRLERYAVRHRLMVDSRCGLIPADAVDREAAAGLVGMGLTFEAGATAARSDYLWRRGRRTGTLTDPPFRVGDVVGELNAVASVEPVLVVGAHGTGYNLFKGDGYPFATSDDCSAAATLNRTGLAWRHLSTVVGVINMVPMTTLDVPLPHELGAEEIERRGWTSRGRISGRPHRIAARPSLSQIRRFVLEEQPTHLALGRMDLLCPDAAGARAAEGLGADANDWINRIERGTGVPVRFVGTGPRLFDVADLDPDAR
jgi:adenylosuccinate synthase